MRRASSAASAGPVASISSSSAVKYGLRPDERREERVRSPGDRRDELAVVVVGREVLPANRRGGVGRRLEAPERGRRLGRAGEEAEHVAGGLRVDREDDLVRRLRGEVERRARSRVGGGRGAGRGEGREDERGDEARGERGRQPRMASRARDVSERSGRTTWAPALRELFRGGLARRDGDDACADREGAGDVLRRVADDDAVGPVNAWPRRRAFSRATGPRSSRRGASSPNAPNANRSQRPTAESLMRAPRSTLPVRSAGNRAAGACDAVEDGSDAGLEHRPLRGESGLEAVEVQRERVGAAAEDGLLRDARGEKELPHDHRVELAFERERLDVAARPEDLRQRAGEDRARGPAARKERPVDVEEDEPRARRAGEDAAHGGILGAC